MSYKITARVYQTNPGQFFRIAEKTVWKYANGGSWGQLNDQQILNMGGSGTSGCLRFMSDDGKEQFIVALGVHNYKRWCDVVTNLSNEQTGVVINPEYYSVPIREQARERQLASYKVNNAQGRSIGVEFDVADGNDLRCRIIIE
ncbi:fungal fruit body lectin [Hymenopellis radicata]|nr:fungal fruit body lectin [Hymenopellis radicata]